MLKPLENSPPFFIGPVPNKFLSVPSVLRQDSNKLQNLIMKVSFLQTSRNKHKNSKLTSVFDTIYIAFQLKSHNDARKITL